MANSEKEFNRATVTKIRYSSSGGFAPLVVELHSEEEGIRSGRINVVRGNSPPVESTFTDGDPISTLIQRILKTQVLSLPEEMRNEKRLGRDLSNVKIEAWRQGGHVTIERDYRFGVRFERSFHQAENLFHELAALVGKND